MVEPQLARRQANGVELAVYEWPGDGPTVFLAHATGFHARIWDRVVARLPGVSCLAIDMRGHGQSEKPPPPYPWRLFADDIVALGRQIGLEGAVGVGHSKGAHAITVAAAVEPGLFARLILIDPVILRREMYAERQMGERAGFTARRRNEWASPEEMFESFKDRAPFASWDAAVLRDYCEHGLLPNPDGPGFVLACPPAIEAAVYAGSLGSDPSGEIAAVDVPVRVLRARQRDENGPWDMSSSPTAPDLAERFKLGEDVFLPQYSHFIPMEAPDLVADEIRQALAAIK